MNRNEEDRIFNGSLDDYEWQNEAGERIERKEVSNYLKEKSQNTAQEAMQKYVALGTVVRIKKVIGSYMVIGFKHPDKNNIEYDYIACEYPYGISEGHMILFNHDQIEKFYHIGMVNDIERAFKKNINNGKNIR